MKRARLKIMEIALKEMALPYIPLHRCICHLTVQREHIQGQCEVQSLQSLHNNCVISFRLLDRRVGLVKLVLCYWKLIETPYECQTVPCMSLVEILTRNVK